MKRVKYNYKILITTSGIGGRLGDLTKDTNKGMIKIRDKPVLAYIIDPYDKDISLVITLGHKGEQVREFITSHYPDRDITFVNVPVYEGDGSSLGHSMAYARDYLQCPFIFHTCDTIPHMFGEPFGVHMHNGVIENNLIVVAPNKNNKYYRTVQLCNGEKEVGYDKVIRILEKGAIGNNPSVVGIIAIKDYLEFWGQLEYLIKLEVYGQLLSEGQVIRSMEADFYALRIPSWWDTGCFEGLQEARESMRLERNNDRD